MAFEFENMLIDRALEIIFLDKNQKVVGALNEIEDFSINTSSETKDKNAADGSLIMRFYNGKNVEVSASNSVVSLSLMGLQAGLEKKIATDGEKLIVPTIKQYEVKAADKKITLDATPVGAITVVGLTKAGVPDASKNYELTTDYTISGKTITFKNLTEDVQVQVYYEFESAAAVQVDQIATNFPKTSHMVAKVIVYDPCDKETARLAYIDFPSFQLSPDFDWTISTDATQPLSGQALVDYCGSVKRLYTVSVSGDEEDEPASV